MQPIDFQIISTSISEREHASRQHSFSWDSHTDKHTKMNKLQFIVKRLSEKPFNRAIRAVDFDENSPDEQLQILNDVLGSLDANLQADVRAAQRDDVVDQILQFLLLHKCDCIPSNGSEDERLFVFVEGLRTGQKDAIYPILHWVLSEYESLEKRTYLSQYLMPVDVPTEYLMQGNGNLEELFEAYKELQAEVSILYCICTNIDLITFTHHPIFLHVHV